MGEATLLTNASDTEGCFMDHLQGNSGFEAGGGLSAPSDQQIPGTDPKVLWHQEPQAQQITRHLVGQQLTNPTLDRGRIHFLEAYLAFRLMYLHCLEAGRSAHASSWCVLIEFFFEGQSLE